MLRAILNKSCNQHPTRHRLYGHLPPITKTIQVRRTRHAGHCWRNKDELISDVLLWTPAYGQTKAGRPARTYIQQLCEDTGCKPEDLPKAMNDREKWRERVRDIHAGNTTWWWWWWSLYILWLTNFYDFRLKSTATAEIGKHPTKAWLSQLVNFKNTNWHFRRTYAIKFCFKLGKGATETYGMLHTAFGASCMNRTSAFEWHKRFKEGRESVRDDEMCGKSKEVNRPELIGQRVRVRVTMLRF